MAENPGGFLGATSGFCFPGSEAGVASYACEFSESRFTEGLFAAHGITEPDSVSRSVPRRRVQYLAGRICARQALRTLSAAEADGQLLIGRDRRPLWPAGYTGSISHCESVAVALACSTTRARGVGVDIESLLSVEVWREISASVTHGADTTFLASAPLEASVARTVLFSAKESFFKAAFGVVGRVFDFDAVSLIGLDIGSGIVRAMVNFDLCREIRRMDEIGINFCAVDDLIATWCILD